MWWMKTNKTLAGDNKGIGVEEKTWRLKRELVKIVEQQQKLRYTSLQRLGGMLFKYLLEMVKLNVFAINQNVATH